MPSTIHYSSPLGELLLAADDIGLTGLWFAGQRYFPLYLSEQPEHPDLPIFQEARAWLDAYFAGQRPEQLPPLHPVGSDFQQEVWALLSAIPYGVVTTYGALAAKIAAARGIASMSAQTVGRAVGSNPLSILIPCHRVVGADGSLTGYAGGVARKAALLELEGLDMARFYTPTRGTAL